MNRRAAVSLAAALSLVSLVAALPAIAHDHEPPRSVLHQRSTEQRGKLGTYCWVYPDENQEGGYIQQCIDARVAWPRAKPGLPGRMARVRFHSAVQPDDLSIAFWRRLDDNDNPVGEGKTLESTLEPYLNDTGETVAWDLVFRLPARGRHLYLHAAGYWPDQDGSEAPQDASWTYHLKLTD